MTSSFRRGLPSAVLLTVVALCAGGLLHGGEDYEGAETCEACHEDLVAAFEFTSHAVAHGWDADTGCESCHGPGGDHVAGDETAIFSYASATPREASATCLECHDRQESHFNSKQAIHRLGDVGCNDCHNPHSTAEKGLERTGAALCQDCHQAITAQFELPRAHPLAEDGAGCANCHQPHASRTLRVNKELFGQTCTNCHIEKEGPFLYQHDVLLVDGCASCHEVHGSPNRHLLKHEPQVNLCYQCHSASVTPTWHSAPRFLNEKCTACHTAIHGSNTNPFFLEE